MAHWDQDWVIRDEMGSLLDSGTAYMEMDEVGLDSEVLAKDYYEEHPDYKGDVHVEIDRGIGTIYSREEVTPMPNDNYKRIKLSPALHTRLKRLQAQLKESTGRFVSQGEVVERALGALEREREEEGGEG